MVIKEPDDWQGSLEYWEKLAEVYQARYRANPRSPIFVPLADAYANMGRKDDAIKILQSGLLFNPHSRAAQILLAQLNYDTGMVSRAREILVDVVERWPDVPAAVSLLCKIYEQEGLFERAGEISRALLNYYPDTPFVKNLAEKYETLAGPAETLAEFSFNDNQEDDEEPAAAPEPAVSLPSEEDELLDAVMDIELNIEPARIAAMEDPPEILVNAMREDRGDKNRANGRAPRKRKKDPRQQTLFALESMLDNISRLKQAEG